MLRELIKEGGLYTIANLLTKGISLLLIPFYSDYFTTAEYGILALLSISGALTAAIFSFQIYQGVGRYISEKENTLADQQRIGSSGLFFTILSYAVFIGLALIFKDSFIAYLSEEEQIDRTTLYWWLATIGLNGIFYTLGVQLRFLRKTKAFSITSFAHAIGNILLILIFALGLDYRIDSIFMAATAITPLIILIQIYYLREYLIFYMGARELKRLFRFSIPLIPASIAYLILNFTDRIFIKEMNDSLGDVGIYDMGFKFSAIVSLIILAFQSALGPIIYEKHQDKDTPSELGRIFRLFIGIGTLGILVLSLFSYETLYIFTQPEYYAAHFIMPLFYLTVLITGFGMFSPGIHVKKKTIYIPFVVITTGLINVGLNAWLIPLYDLEGAAFATLISTFLNFLTLFIISQRLFPIQYPKKRILFVFCFFLIIFSFGWSIPYFLEWDYLSILLLKIALILGYVFFLIKSNFVGVDQIRHQFQKRFRKTES